MKASEKIKDILQILERHFPVVDPPLQHKDTYTLLVAVLLSARCTDERVNKVTPILFDKADTPQRMTELSVDQIRDIIKPCGLSPTKAKAIAGLSRILVEDYQGKVPGDMEALEALPGVGHKTASVVMAQGFGKPSFPVDTHIHRLAYRWGLSDGKSVEKTERDLKKMIPENLWNKAHLQIIFFGRAFCPARGHDWKQCPICSKYMRPALRGQAPSAASALVRKKVNKGGHP